MKINTTDLHRVLAAAQKVAPRRAAMPILATAKLAAQGGVLTVEATDLRTHARWTLPCEGDLAPCAAAIERMAAVLASIAGDTCEVALADGWLALSCESMKTRFFLHDVRDWPAPIKAGKQSTTADVDAQEFAALLRVIAPLASTDETRPHLNCVCLHVHGGRLIAVATNGHALACVPVAACATDIGECLLPLSAVRAVATVFAQAAGRVAFGFGAGTVTFRAEGVDLTVRPDDAQYPPWRQTVPRAGALSASATVATAALRAVIDRASSIADGIVLASGDGAIDLSATDPEAADLTDRVDADVQGEFRVGMSASYLASALDAVAADRVVLRFGGELDPARIDPVGADTGRLAVVMPMRV